MKALAWVMALVLGLFVLAYTPEGGDSDGRSQPNPNGGPGQNAEADPIVRLETFVDDKCSPYEVTINVQGGSGNLPPGGKVPVASGAWTHDMSYQSGKKLAITLGIFAKPGCSGGRNYCKISDGPLKGSGAQPLLASGTVICKYTTSR